MSAVVARGLKMARRMHCVVALMIRGPPLAPKKLTELPPAIGYMAVYRQIGGCEAPLTMVEYRRPQRR